MIETGKDFVDYYALFEVTPDASDAEIRQAFMRHAKQQHPDAGGSLAAMQQLNLAYATLKNERTRRAYDMMHSFQIGTSSLHYREIRGEAIKPVASDMADDEVDDFINAIFAEYAAKPPKSKLYVQAKDKAKNALKFRKKPQ